MSETMLQALQMVFLDPMVWGMVIAAACYGVFIGSMPGLTATMGVALFVPMTFWLGPVPALAAIVTMVACAIFAGDIPATLMRIPGTPASAAYTGDAYALARRGESNRALGVSLWFSVTGGIFGALVLMLVGHQLARIAGWFSVAEYFWLYLAGLSCAVIVGQASPLRALVGMLAGLLLSTVGLSAVHGQARFTFGQVELYQGINFIPAMVGLFGMSEVLRNAMNFVTSSGRETASPKPVSPEILRPAVRLFGQRIKPWVRSNIIGSFIGILPGAGADMASWVASAVSKRRSRKPEEHGNGSEECIADACTANSASLAGSWIPALVFGIPGDSITAIVIGVLYMKNLKPGPEIFEQQGALVYSIYLIFILANLVLLPVGLLAIRAGGVLMRLPSRVLLPVILLFCVVGSYAVNGSLFDVWLMIGFGLLGLLCERWKISIGALVLGILLGGPLEERFVQTLARGQGSLWAFVDRPYSATMAVICLLIWGGAMLSAWRRPSGPPLSQPNPPTTPT